MNNTGREIAKSAILVTCMMLAFKVLGFVKQAIVAYVFGATAETDIYFIAWGFVSGISEAIVKALLVSLVAVYTNTRIKKGKEYACKLVNALIEILVPVFLIITVVVYSCAPLFSKFIAPTYDNNNMELLVFFIQILSPLLLFACFELIFGAIEDSYKEFFVPRIQSLLYSISVIASCVFFSKQLGIYALIVAQFSSVAVYTVLLFVAVRRHHSYNIVKPCQIPEIKEVLITAVPLFIGNSALQINQIVDKSITSGLDVGATSALSYCQTLEQFVTNIMIVNIGNVMFANFAELVAKEDYEKVNSVLTKTINILVILLIGVSTIVMFCSEDIVSIVYYRGSFSYNAVKLTANALRGYAIAFTVVAIRDLSVKSLYAFKNTAWPMVSSIISIIVNIAFSIFLSRRIGILGVTLATSVSAFVGAILNGLSLKRHIPKYRYSEHVNVIIKCIPALCVMTIICSVVKKIFIIGLILKLILCTIFGLSAYFSILYICKVQEVRNIVQIGKNRFFKEN